MSLPESCQLHPSVDLYAEQEAHKKEVTRGDWRCLLCGKHFRSEFYIDRHMHNKHTEKLSGSGTSICLADLCPIFGCTGKEERSRGLPPPGPRRSASSSSFPQTGAIKDRSKKDFAGESTCTQEEVERSKYRCEVLAKRCFGSLSDGGKTEAHFHRTVCKRLHCQGGLLRGILPEDGVGGGGGNFVFWLLRALLAALILLFLLAYCLFVGVDLSTVFGGKNKGTGHQPPSLPSGFLASLTAAPGPQASRRKRL